MSEIKFKLVDGEPVCTGNDCPCADDDNPSAWEFDGVECTVNGCVTPKGALCIPGLRQQRDALKEQLEEVRNKRRDDLHSLKMFARIHNATAAMHYCTEELAILNKKASEE